MTSVSTSGTLPRRDGGTRPAPQPPRGGEAGQHDQQARQRQQQAVAHRRRLEAELDPVPAGGDRHRAQQVVGPEDRRRLAVHVGLPVRVPQIRQPQQRRPGRVHVDGDAVQVVGDDVGAAAGDRAEPRASGPPAATSRRRRRAGAG